RLAHPASPHPVDQPDRQRGRGVLALFSTRGRTRARPWSPAWTLDPSTVPTTGTGQSRTTPGVTRCRSRSRVLHLADVVCEVGDGVLELQPWWQSQGWSDRSESCQLRRRSPLLQSVCGRTP